MASQRRFVYLVVALLCAGGIWAALRLPSAIYPELQFPRITIVAQGSALGARQVVFAITRPIEEAVGVVPGVTRVTSRSIRGASEISITLAPNTDMAYALQQTQARVNELRGDLPAGLDIQVERLSPSLFPIISYNLEGGDPTTMYDIARYQIRPVLSRVPGVGRVDVQASDVREIEVVADPVRLAEQGLSYEDLASAIRSATSASAVGRVAQDYKQLLVVTASEATRTEDVANVVVGRGLRVRDVATVELGTEDHVRIVAGDGRPAALLNITRQVGGNTVAIADSVERAAATLRRTLPAGVTLKAVYDQASLVREATKSVRDAMLVGAVLAVAILFIFLRRARITAISAASIPLTLAITVFVMSLVGQTFNLMTLGAMAIAIGLVIDDAVVITENIVRHLGFTPDRGAAIREAVQELILPGDDVDDHDGGRLPSAPAAGGRGRAVLRRAVDHADDRRARVARARGDDHPAAGRELPHGGARRATIARRAGRPPEARGARAVLARVGRGARRAVGALRALARRRAAPHAPHARRCAAARGGRRASRTASSPPASSPRSTKARSCSTTSRPGGTALVETDRQVHIAERILLGDAGDRGDLAADRRGARPVRDGAEHGRRRRAAHARRASATRSSQEVIDDARTKIESAAPRHAHRVRADPERRDQRSRRRGASGGDQAVRRRSRRAGGVCASGSSRSWRRSMGWRTSSTA